MFAGVFFQYWEPWRIAVVAALIAILLLRWILRIRRMRQHKSSGASQRK